VLTVATPEGRTPNSSGWAQEISLDVEWAHAIAPAAHILLVEARSSSLSDLLTAVDYATNHGAQTVSMSWGAGEFSSESSYDGHFLHTGVTYVASSGDTGSLTEWPAVSPNVVGVGGTALNVDSSGTYLSETGWSGSGGGISAYEAKPGYQSGVTLSATKRTTPDVAYDASPSTGVAVYDSYFGGGGWGQYGGTSAGAPQWAALIALANQGRSTPLSSSGTLNAIYSGTTNFHDVTSGSSGTYSAGTGYDLVTGIGSPMANNLIAYLHGVSANVGTSGSSGSGGAPGGSGHNIEVGHSGDQSADDNLTSGASAPATTAGPQFAPAPALIVLTVPVVPAVFATPTIQISSPLPLTLGAAPSLPALPSAAVPQDSKVDGIAALPISEKSDRPQGDWGTRSEPFGRASQPALNGSLGSADVVVADPWQQVQVIGSAGTGAATRTSEATRSVAEGCRPTFELVASLAGVAFAFNGFWGDPTEEFRDRKKRPTAPQ
jgi:hypothetical protein